MQRKVLCRDMNLDLQVRMNYYTQRRHALSCHYLHKGYGIRSMPTTLTQILQLGDRSRIAETQLNGSLHHLLATGTCGRN